MVLVVVLGSIAVASGSVAAGLVGPADVGERLGRSPAATAEGGSPDSADDDGDHDHGDHDHGDHDHGDHDHGDHDHHHASALSPDGRFTGPGEVWPPQPRDATDTVTLAYPGQESPSDTDLVPPQVDDQELVPAAAPLEAALADQDVLDALGARYHLIAASDGAQLAGGAKGEMNPDASRIIFYSLTYDQSIEVLVVASGVREVRVQPAGDYQPPMSEKEKYRAAELARAHWEAIGDPWVDDLEAFVMLDMADDGTFHSTRVAYVSFHAGINARPELLTWVDLSVDQVTRAVVDR